jgi:foldase protein PrsA
MLNHKTLWVLIFGLVGLNCLTVLYFLKAEETASSAQSTVNAEDEVIAKIGNEQITRQEWLEQLEEEYGKNTLEQMVNEKVIEQAAKKYGVTITDDMVEREMNLIKTMYNTFDSEKIENEEKWKHEIKHQLMLEELLTKDVDIPENELKNYYEENKDLYEIKDTYHLSHIVVPTKEEAKQVIQELKGGSSFNVLAMEKSKDEFTANQGGELGFISVDSDFVPPSYIKAAKSLKENEWSQPIPVEHGYAIILLHEKMDGITYSFEDVKEHIRRQIALEQMNGEVSPKPFWDEVGVTWFYGDQK